MSEHILRGNGPVHSMACGPCAIASADKIKRDQKQNPHRIGTKARAKRAREDAAVRWATDPRSETYWSS